MYKKEIIVTANYKLVPSNYIKELTNIMQEQTRIKKIL